jgi:hypothetical protein
MLAAPSLSVRLPLLDENPKGPNVAFFSGVGAFHDCAALLGGNGRWLDIPIRADFLSIGNF